MSDLINERLKITEGFKGGTTDGATKQLEAIIAKCESILNKLDILYASARMGYLDRVNSVASAVNKLDSYCAKHTKSNGNL